MQVEAEFVVGDAGAEGVRVGGLDVIEVVVVLIHYFPVAGEVPHLLVAAAAAAHVEQPELGLVGRDLIGQRADVGIE